MSLCIIGDLHFKVKTPERNRQIVSSILKIVSKKQPDCCILLGDVFDTHNIIHCSILFTVSDFLKRLQELTTVIVVVGNHDMSNQQDTFSGNHAFSAFSGENLNIVDKPTPLEIAEKNILLVPYTPPGTFIESVSKFIPNWDRFDLIIAHQEFTGCKMGSIISNCEEWKDSYPPCISGHIHERQFIGENLLYLGTPVQHGYGDDSEKGIGFLDISGDVDLSSITFKELNVKKKSILNIDYEELDKAKKYEDKFESSDVKLVIRGSSTQIQQFKKSKDFNNLKKKCNLQFFVLGDEAKTQMNNVDSSIKNSSYLEILELKIKESKDKYMIKEFQNIISTI